MSGAGSRPVPLPSSPPVPGASAPRARGASRFPVPAVICAVLTACASSQSPPGGPPDALPPEIERTSPESASTGVRPGRVVFELNEVVSERPQGAATLTALFLVSPRDGEPRVEWKRDRILVRPRRDWRPNTVYTVTMLPGLTDLRGNVRREGATLVFSTGATIPNTALRGIVWDWPAGRAGARALVQAITASDTTISYVTVADSAGRFALPHLPPGNYVVRGVLDQNGNRVLDRREAYDSTLVTFTDTSTVELLAFVHDTIGPRIATAAPRDSVLRVTFDKPLDPGQTLDAIDFRLVALPDSSPVAIARVSSARAWTADEASARARADSARRPAPDDTSRGAAAARAAVPQGLLPGERAADAARPDTSLRPSRPSPESEVVVVVGAPLLPGTTYRLRAIDVRNLMGVPRTSDRNFTIPRPTPRDTTTPAPGDSARQAPAAATQPAPGTPATTPSAPPGGATPPRPPADSARRVPLLSTPGPRLSATASLEASRLGHPGAPAEGRVPRAGSGLPEILFP